MNNWRVVGYIFAGLGVLLLIVGLILGREAYNAVSYAPELAQTAFLAAFTNYGGVSVLLILVGAVGLYMGRAKVETPAVSRIRCGSCGTT